MVHKRLKVCDVLFQTRVEMSEMEKRILGDKRAFSPVIAALILMLIAVAAGVVVYGYVMG